MGLERILLGLLGEEGGPMGVEEEPVAVEVLEEEEGAPPPVDEEILPALRLLVPPPPGTLLPTPRDPLIAGFVAILEE